MTGDKEADDDESMSSGPPEGSEAAAGDESEPPPPDGGSEEEDSDDDDDGSDDEEDSDDDDSEDDDDDDGDDNEVDENGLTKYERLRMERIKRNQERLAQLGLQSKDGEGVLGQKPKQKRNRNKKPQEPVEQREKLSRRTKTEKVDYSGELNLRMLMDAEKEEKRKAKLARKAARKGNNKKGPKSHDERVPLWIYQEFRRIASTRKENVKLAKRHARSAAREVKYWEKQVNFIEHRESSVLAKQQQQRQLQQERQLLGGKTQQEILSELEQRMPELQAIVAQYDATQMSAEERERQILLKQDEWHKKHALDRKMNMIDALETFPKSINEAMSTLNALLVQRSPKDPPPPRRSRRSMAEEEEAAAAAALKSPKKKKAKKNSAAAAASPDEKVDANWSTLAANLAAAAARDTKTQLASLKSDNPNEDENQDNAAAATTKTTRKRRPKDARNVGGWVSPLFSQQLDRTWLERTKPLKRIQAVPPQVVPKGSAMTVFDVNAYVAQPGDVVLFYPSAYKEFLEVHPDTLGSRLRNVLRVPLWNRARRQLGRLKGGTASDEDQRDIWFTEEWIASLAGKKGGGGADNGIHENPNEVTLGDYPILCQVIRTHAEFPPDPYSKEKSISKTGDGTTISWAKPSAAKLAATGGNKKQKSADRPQIRHAVTMKPLTTVLPPHMLGKRQQHSPAAAGVPPVATETQLRLPPNFTVITNPVSAPLEPHLIPFCYAYTTFHSLSMSEGVYVRRAENEDYYRDDSKTKRAGKSAVVKGKGRVVEFAAAPEVTELPSQRPWENNTRSPRGGGGGGGTGLLDMHDLNPMMGLDDPLQAMNMDFGDPMGDDPFALEDDVLDALGDPMDWHQQPGQAIVSPQRTGVQSIQSAPINLSLRVEDRRDELEAILAPLQSGEALAEALSSNSFPSSMPLREGGIILDFLKMMIGDTKKERNGAAPTSSSSLMDFIHSTLPIRRGVTVTTDSNRRQSHLTNPWHLVPFSPNEYVRNTIQDGFLGTLENSTREKAVMGLEDLIEYHQPNSQLFVGSITEEMVPGYYGAVPVGMCFDRIFARLKANASGQCYYTSTDSIIMDLTAIAENCMLFNSPDSDLVAICNGMIAECKKLLIEVGKSSADDVGKAAGIVTTRRKRSNLIIPDDLNAPYKDKLYREWFQRIAPDSGREGSKTAARHWLPQCGDNIVYSRSRHKEFITGHLASLAEIQCQLPGFQAVDEESSLTTEELESMTMSKWLKGTVMSVRTTFPLAQTGKTKDSFSKPSPILVVELQLNYTWCQDTVIVFWRPCVLPSESANECKTCGLSLDSFLMPDWASIDGAEILEGATDAEGIPKALDDDANNSMKRCFDLLMRRSLVDVPPVLVNVQEALSMAERNVAIHPGSRTLPSFEDLLLPSDPGKKKEKQTRGVKKPEDPSTVSKLAESGFLPLWSPEWLEERMKLGDRKDKVVPKHETQIQFPSLCLELIRLRIANGFYRNVLAVVNDISEAYVAAVFYMLSGPASRKMNKVSIRNIAKHLASTRGNPKMPKLYYKRQNKKSMGGNESNAKQDLEDLSESFSPEEITLISKIGHIRSFHATAIVFATQAMTTERLFCLRTYPVPPPPEIPVVDPVEQGKVDYNDEQLQMVSKIRWILQSVGRDPSQNRFPIVQSKKYNLKISCGGQIIGESGDLQALADGVTYFRQSSALASLPKGQAMRVRVRVGDEYVYGDDRPVASNIATPGWPMPHSAAKDAISLQNVKHQIPLEFRQFERNEELTRAIYGLPGKRFPCIKCQSKGNSTFTCRVKKAHSNLDFSIVEHFQGTIGVESLFMPWKSRREKAKAIKEAGGEPEEQEEDSDEENNDEDGEGGKDVVDEAKKADATRAKRATQARENLVKAREAQSKAEYLRTQATLLNQLEVKLSPEFIKMYFPVDDEDNHYTLCIHCGTPGNLLLCDGCSNVAHPQCLGMQVVPDGDWFCPKCVKEKGLPEPIRPPPAPKETAAAAPKSPRKTGKSDAKESAAANGANGDATGPNDTVDESKPSADAATSADETGKPAAEAPKKAAPPPEITDEQFETQELALSEVIEALSSQHPAPTPKPKLKEAPVEEASSDDDSPAKGKKKRGRPSKRRSQATLAGIDDPIEALSANARAFLESIDITSGADFLSGHTTEFGNHLIKWRKKQGMPPLKGGGHIATISGWKAIVRNAGGVEYLDDDPDEFAEVLPQAKPRSRSSIEKRAANAMAAPKAKRKAQTKPGKQRVRRSDNPIENLPVQAQSFLKYLKIVDPDEFLTPKSSELAEHLVKFRRKEKLPVLNGSGPSAYVAQWKSALRREVAYQKTKEEERATNSRRRNGKVKRGSKVQDVEEAPEAKRLRQNNKGSAKKKSKQKKSSQGEEVVDDSGDVSFNVLEEAQKMAAEEEEEEKEPHDWGSPTPGRRRRTTTNRFAP